MVDLIVLPDAIGPIITFLNGLPEVTALGLEERIGTSLGTEGLWPAVRIDPTGGITPIEYRLDQPFIVFQCFAETDVEAMTIARTLKAGVSAMTGYRVAGVAVFTNVDTTSARLIDDPSRTALISHASFSAIVTIRPDP